MEASGHRLPTVRKQLVDAAAQVRGQPIEHIAQAHMRIVSIELGRLHQAHHDGRSLAG